MTKTYIKQIIGLLVAILLVSSCYREKPINSEIGKPLYTIEDSDDPLDHLIYQVYKESDVQILYDFDPKVARWNLGSILGAAGSGGSYVPFDLEDTEKVSYIKPNLDRIIEDFFDQYPVDFQRKYMPLRIFLCDTIVKTASSQYVTYYGIDNMAINLFTPGEKDHLSTEYTKPVVADIDEYYSKISGKLHSALFAFLFTFREEAPNQFVQFSQGLYGKRLRSDLGLQQQGDNDFDVKTLGFWSASPDTFYDDNLVMHKEPEDIAEYVERMVGYTEAENMAEMEGYAVMINKYNALRNYIKEAFGFDLQEIGNNK